MSYSFEIFDSITDVDVEDWNQLRREGGDPFMDVRFIRAVENSMGKYARFRHVIFREGDSHPVAVVCLSSYRVDGTLLADGWLGKVARFFKRLAPRLLSFNVIFCGLPVSAGQSHLRFAPDADREAVLEKLNELAFEFAEESKARCIVFKELRAEETEQVESLEKFGYLRADSLPMNRTRPDFDSFADFCAHLNSRRRYPIKRSQRKFAKSGLRVVQMHGGEGVEEIYTDEVHQLYEAVLRRAEVRLEHLPADFFRELARQLPDQSAFTFIYSGDRVVAFAASVFTDSVYHQLFVGVDYSINADCDLYFNLFFQAMDYGFRRGVSGIYVGQSADTFKHQKLRCYQEPLYFFIRGADAVTSWVLRAGFDLFFPSRWNGEGSSREEAPAKISTEPTQGDPEKVGQS